MRGLMMDRPLLTTALTQYAATYHGDREIVSRTVEGPIHRYTYRDCYARAAQLAHALVRLGVQPGERVATLAWNGYRHLELYYAISGLGAVCHTVNPRLFGPQIAYILDHAQDRHVFTDLTFVPVLEALAGRLAGVKGVVVMTDAAHMPAAKLPNLMCYEDLIAGEPTAFDWPGLDENTASSLCYTSGTTGNPKGVLYSHRSTVLHAFGACSADSLAIASRESVMPVVPLFHVNAWGIPYAAAMAGAKLVLPGPQLDGASLHDLIEREQVTFTAGVPTVWLKLFEHLEQTGKRFSSLKRMVVGGSAMPLSLIAGFEEKYGVAVAQAWGMTELSPIGTTGLLKPAQLARPARERHEFQATQGRPVFGVDFKIVDAAGKALPHDGESRGELLVRGPWVTCGYYNDAAASAGAFDAEGWFRTGDVATIHPDGWMKIVDRVKDLIKSGGEWISSIDLENAAIGHPAIQEAAAIGVPHPRWSERPILVVVPKPDAAVDRDSVLAFLQSHLAKWQLPDDVVFVKELPHTATGKLLKSDLRERFRNHRLATP